MGLIGFGGWARRLVGAVQGKSKSVRFSAAVTRTPGKVTDFATAQGMSLDGEPALGAMLQDPSIDGVVVCGPAHVHVRHTTQAIEAGKHVLVIKPLAQTRSDAEALYRAAAERGVFLGLGYERCFLPAADELRRRVAAGDLGRIVHVEGNYSVGRYHNMTRDDWKTDAAIVPPGALADHMLYMMVELLGPVESLCARGANLATDLDAADTSAVMLRFADGASGLLSAIGVTANFARLQFFGTEGWAEIRGASRFEFSPRKGDGGSTVTDYPEFDTLRAQLERFAAAAKGEVAFPMTPDHAIASVAAIEAMGLSARTDGFVDV